MHYLKYMLLINTYYIIGGGRHNTTLIAGVFRAGGDTKVRTESVIRLI